VVSGEEPFAATASRLAVRRKSKVSPLFVHGAIQPPTLTFDVFAKDFIDSPESFVGCR